MALDPQSRLEVLLAKHERLIRDAFLTMVGSIQSSVVLDVIADLIEKGDLLAALNEALRNAPAALGTAATQAFVDAAGDTAKFLGKTLGEIIIDFDQTNTRAVAKMRANQLRLVAGFTNQQSETVRQVLIDGIRDGVNPRELARRFRDSIGLTATQERAVTNFRRALEDLDRDALTRELRDRRFDPTIARAIRNNEPFTAKQIETITKRYRERFLIFRSETIARTEALRSVHEGSQELYLQALESGELSREQLTREWNTARDERVRGSHAVMDGQLRGIDEHFISGLGSALMFPGDSSAPAADVINCRCTVGTRIVSIESVVGAIL